MDKCVLCKESQGQMNVVGEKGFNTLLRISLEKDESELHKELTFLKEQESKVLVHHDCRRRFVKRKKEKDSEPEIKRLRSPTNSLFDWKRFCFLCGNAADIHHNKNRKKTHQVSTLPLHENLVRCARERRDEKSDAVLRQESCTDLVAVEAIYHLDCACKPRLKTSGQSRPKGKPNKSPWGLRSALC